MAEITFTPAEAQLKGKRAAIVAQMVQRIVDAGPEGVVTWDELIQDIEHPHQYTPALYALEIVGAVQRWDYSEGGRAKKTAYSLSEMVEVMEGP